MEQKSKKSKIWILLVIVLVIVLVVVGCLLGKKHLSKTEPSSNNNKNEEKEEIDVALYDVCDDDSCIYVLGAIHVGDGRILNLPKKVLDAYNVSEALAVEVDIVNISLEDQSKLLSLIMLPDGDELSNHLTPEQYHKLETFLTENNVGIEEFKTLTLAGVYSVVSELIYQNYPIPGTDSQLLLRAKMDEKEVIELETYDFQMNLLYGKSEEEYVENIMQIIDNFEEEKKGVSSLYEAYVSANVKELETILLDDAIGNEEEYNELVYDRNIPMADKAEKFLKENKKVMITVGAAHVIGDKGIVQLLEDRGYKVSLVK